MKLTKSAVICLTALALIGLLAGCATIVGDATHLMPIKSQPSGATIIITDERGAEVFHGTTPTQVTLNKSDGSYWGGKSYTVAITKDGYQTRTISVKTHPNGLYVVGNLIFGGLVGWFILDPFTGNMYTLSPRSINTAMPATAPTVGNDPNEKLSIMLLDDVPGAERVDLVPLR